MLIVADINTLWRSCPFQALSELRPVLGLAPMDPLIAMRHRRLPWGAKRGTQQKMTVLSIVLPFGWATRRAAEVLPRLWTAALKECHSVGADPSALVVTSPHYAPLVRDLSSEFPICYYCSDDYMNYAGWNSNEMRQQESVVVQNAKHSFFVSEALRDRAVKEYAIDPARASVSINATDEEFLAPVSDLEIDRLLSRFRKLTCPIAGVIGGISDRLDFDLIGKVAESDTVGSVLLVGPVAAGFQDARLDTLRRNPKCIFAGEQAHDALRVWLRAVDVVLIPFRSCHFNTMCSPMRLFDHLAAGRPIVATDACPQVREFQDCVMIASTDEEFLEKVKQALSAPADSTYLELMRKRAREHTWAARALTLNSRIDAELEKAACKADSLQ